MSKLQLKNPSISVSKSRNTISSPKMFKRERDSVLQQINTKFAPLNKIEETKKILPPAIR